MKLVWLAFPLFALAVVPCTLASTINVPKDQPTIQAGINAANNGDTVLVAPGKYVENINFNGKTIKVTSAKGPKVTVIDGNAAGPVAVFMTNDGAGSVLSGFTLQNGTSTLNGGGIYISGASATVKGNVVQSNSAGNFGGGIEINSGSPLIQGNIIRKNSASFGGGFSVEGPGSARILGNKIYGNTGTSAGGGMILFDAGTPTIENNVIRSNSAEGGQGQGGGMWIVNDSDALIVQNLIFANSAAQGGGIYLSVPEQSVGPLLVNNTIIGGSGVPQGSAVWAGGFDDQVQFFNNLMIGLSGQNAVDCDGTYSQQPPTFTNNDAYSPKGTGFQGTCASQSNQNGNISASPKFVDPAKRNYQLLAGSHAINAGTTSAPDLPKKDLAGHRRIVDGKIDMGAYEHQAK
jgi:parallel beta-helix repeat protein